MKKLLVLIVLLVVVGLTLVETRPSREAHKEAVMNVAKAVVNAEMSQKDMDETLAAIGTMLGISAVDVYLNTNLIVREHTFYNVGMIVYKEEPWTVSVGVFNHVFTISEDDAKRVLKDKLSLSNIINEQLNSDGI